MERLGAMLGLLMVLQTCLAAAAALQQRGPRCNVTCMLVFGDSTVDPGNNNKLGTNAKANFLPYGMNFFEGKPTGRFSDGRLATDFIAEMLGMRKGIPAFLDPNLSLEQLRHGVSFASASSGYDDLTAMNANVLPFSRQIQYLRHYKIHLNRLVGPMEAEQIIKNALFVVSAGTNDFIQNYYVSVNRSSQYTLPQYQNFLITLMSNYVQEMHRLGGTRFVVVGLPPMGCLPIVKTFLNLNTCAGEYNDVAISYNSKLVAYLPVLKKRLGVRVAYGDIYTSIWEAITNPAKYGLKETSKGCCGSGLVEVGESCRGQSICRDPRMYLFWDAVHLTERMYGIIGDNILRNVAKEILG